MVRVKSLKSRFKEEKWKVHGPPPSLYSQDLFLQQRRIVIKECEMCMCIVGEAVHSAVMAVL
jgi:hypothetical protein